MNYDHIYPYISLNNMTPHNFMIEFSDSQLVVPIYSRTGMSHFPSIVYGYQ